MWRSPRRFHSPHGERYIEAPYRLFFTTRQKLSAFRHDRRPYEHDILMRTVADSCSRVDDPRVQIKTGKDISLASFRHARNINFDPGRIVVHSVEFYQGRLSNRVECTIENIKRTNETL